MSVTKEDLGGNKVRLKITVPASIFQENIEKAYRKKRGQFAAPGFRKGHVPRPVIEQMNGANVFYPDAFDMLLAESLGQAYDELGLDVVAPADNLQIETMSRDDGVVYTVDVYVRPKIELGQYEGLDVTEHTYAVKDKDVDEYIEQVRKENVRWLSKEDAAAEGDLVSIDYAGRLDGEAFDGGSGRDMRLVLGNHTMIPGFEDQIVGMRPGEDRTITVTFPENYEPSLAGREAEFDIHLTNVETGELPELDDDFAEDVSGLSTLAEYRDTVRGELQNTMDKRSTANVEAQLIDQVVRNTSVDVPPPMIDMQYEDDLQQLARDLAKQGTSVEGYLKATGMTSDQLAMELRRGAEQSVKTSLILARLVEALDTDATDEDLDKEIGAMAEKSNISLEQAKQNVMPEGMRALANNIAIAKTLARLKELANVTVVVDETPDFLLGIIPEQADRPEDSATEQSDENTTVEE